MADAFQYDVFPSHSAKDKAVVRPLADRLRKDGLKVWFDEWVLPVAASRQSAASSSEKPRTGEDKDGGVLPRRRYEEMIEEGLEHSRVLTCPALASERRQMLGMSANAFGSIRDPIRPAFKIPSSDFCSSDSLPVRQSREA